MTETHDNSALSPPTHRSGAGNCSRPTAILHPGGRQESCEYNFALDNAISRIDSIDDSGGGQVRAYEFLGLSTAVVFDGNNVTLSYVQQPGDTLTSTDGGDQYTGLDRFGRVIDQNWLAPSSVGGSVDRLRSRRQRAVQEEPG